MMNLFSKGMDLLDGRKREDMRLLIDYVRRGDVDYIKTVDPNVLLRARDGKDEDTALLIATNEGNLNICKEILKKCPSLLYQENTCGFTVLHKALDIFDSFLFIDFFVGAGLNELVTSNGETYKTFKRWMNMKDVNGNTALLKAIDVHRNLLIVKRFVEVDREYHLRLSERQRSLPKGLERFMKEERLKKNPALDCAVNKKDQEMVKLLTDQGDLYSDSIPYSTVTDLNTATNLFRSLFSGDLDYIKTVELNVLLNFRDEKGTSVLCIATRWDQLDCCKQILKRCPSLLYHQNNLKWSVLHHAADRKFYRLIDFFVSVGQENAKIEDGMENMICFKNWINLQNESGDTALVLAVKHRCSDMVKRFADVDHQYKLGLSKIVGAKKKTALELAVFKKYYELINLLTCNIPILSAIQQAQEPLQTGNKSGHGAVVTESNIFTFTEVSKHNNSEDCWLLINGKVYDVTKFLGDHPGGSEVLLKATGKDATTDFKNAHSNSSDAATMMDKFYVGVCDSITSSLSELASDKPRPYSQLQLKEFTKDFSQLLGSGGFGDVYKGQFPDGVFIAVKVLKNIEFKEKVMEEQFVAEVHTMGRAYHRNLIKLYGYCYEANTKFKALVYDYMENGSLDTILFEKKLDIPWAKLHNIAKEIAQGISYLHESCYPQIIHQDIKPANVLLDSNLSPKVIDFGLAKVNMGDSQFEQTKIKGSRNYMAPEVNQPEQVKLSCKLDVYSFGKVLFDILGSKRRNHVDKSSFPTQVWEKYRTNQLDAFILDCGIKEDDKENAKRLAQIALLCVEHNPQTRPKLSNVVKMLEGEIKQLDTPDSPFYPNYYPSESSSMNDSRD